MAIDTQSTNYDAALQRSTMRWIFELAANNPGATNVLCWSITELGMTRGLAVLRDVEAAKMRGPDIWVCFKDDCGSDIALFAKTCAKRAEVSHDA